MIEITEDQLDLLKEVFNIGVGRAAASLSLLADNKYEVLLSLPKLQIISMAEMVNILESETSNKITTVSQHYSGPFKGIAHVIFSQNSILKLVSIMLQSSLPQHLLSELESDALMEVGNILNNACLSALSKMFREEIETGLPQITSGTPREVFYKNSRRTDFQIAFIRSEFQIQEESLRGYISLFIETEKLKNLLACIDKYNETLLG